MRANFDSLRAKIIGEIQRLAKNQNGKAPGKVLFERETGIKESEWYGKIWLRWNDAVIEARHVPNDRQEKFSTDMVLEKYAEVCRFYGKPPSNAELHMYARNTQDFISPNTFASHFKSKNGAIVALRNWATDRDDQELIQILPETPSDTVEKIRAEKEILEGHVYLLQSGAHYKIGRSSEIERRVKAISISLPDKVELVHAISTDDPPGIEAYWHRRFAAQRVNGEWFKLTISDVKAFKRRKFQ